MVLLSLISVARVIFNNAILYILFNLRCTQFTGLTRVSSNWNPLFLCLSNTPKRLISFNNRSVNNFSRVFLSLFFAGLQNHPAQPDHPLPYPVNCTLADGYAVERGGKQVLNTLKRNPFKKPLIKSWETGCRYGVGAGLNHPPALPGFNLSLKPIL